MNHARIVRAGTGLALALLLLAPVALAGDMDKSMDDATVALTGQLAKDSMGSWILIEEASGDSITLSGGEDLASLEGARVRVTGTWIEDAEGGKVLEVGSIEKADEAS